MAGTLPDKGEGQNDLQSVLFQEYLDVIVAGIQGIDAVLVGCAVTAQGSPDMTVAVAKGAVLSNGALFPVTAGNATITTADGTNPRLDLVVVNNAGTKAVRAGTAAANPKPPARSANDVVLAVVYVPAADTTISAAQIVDQRSMRTQGPILLKKITTPVTVANSAAIQTFFTLTVPNGLFLSGRIIRVRVAGSFLLNSGTADLVTLTISYGGTTMYADITTGVSVASALRRPFFVEFDLVAQANNDQQLQGRFELGALGTAAPPAATTGFGAADSALAVGARSNHNAFSGSAAIDSDAADNDLLVRFTHSVANAAIDTTMESATAELL